MPSKGFQLTPEQIALSEERKRLKLQREREKVEQGPGYYVNDARGQILQREWIKFNESGELPSKSNAHIVKIMTWNLLAQTLVRRTLFPHSDCLKGSEREPMLFTELLSHNADICCLQELDQTEKILPLLENAGYSYVYKAGHKKKHGSLIAYRMNMFTKIDERTVEYDAQTVRPEHSADGVPLSQKTQQGGSFFTKNIANLVALRRNLDEHDGVIVATTHLFWHPKYTYERARQVAILVREVDSFRQALNCAHWPCIVAGDFNFTPEDAAYALLVGDPLLPEHAARLAFSRVVHLSIDPMISTNRQSTNVEDDEGGEEARTAEEKIIWNSRPAEPDDGLLSDEDFVQLFKSLPRPISAYDRGFRQCQSTSVKDLLYGSRVPIPDNRHGAFEPAWTSYTHYWKTVLDYIFVISPADRPVRVTGLANPHPMDKLDPGIPRKGVCGSDHISLCAELSWPAPL